MKERKSEYSFVSSTGLPVAVSRVHADDAEYLIDLFEHLSADSRYMRFNQFLAAVDPQIVRREAEHIALVDPAQGLALLAFADLPGQPNAPVAGARYVRTADPEQAEVSVSVRDDMQHQGIGGQLLFYLMSEARKAGVRSLIATFQTNNRRVWALLAESPYESSTVIEGYQTTVTIDLQRSSRAPDDGNLMQVDSQIVR